VNYLALKNDLNGVKTTFFSKFCPQAGFEKLPLFGRFSG
jgi:hypothetical protein